MMCAILGVASLAVAQTVRTLIINGKTASTDIRIIDGRAYVPLADIAKALDLGISIKGSTYELTKAGGTGQVNGLMGKTGDWLFDGGWRFRVNNTFKTDKYTAKNDWYGENEFEAPEGKEMIIVEYSYRNGGKEMYNFSIGKTSLAGKDGTAFSLASNDFPFDGSRLFSQGLMPGSQGDGALIFFVKSGFELKDLILTVDELAGYDDSTRPKKPTVFRISLQSEN